MSKQRFNLQEIFFFILLIGLSLAFIQVIYPFIPDIFLMMVLFIIFQKPHKYFLKKFKNRKTLAASTTITLIFLVLVIPTAIVATMITKEATQNYKIIVEYWPKIEQHLSPEALSVDFEHYPWISRQISNIDINVVKEKFDGFIVKSTGYMLNAVQSTFMNISSFLLHFFVVFFLLFYLLIDGERLVSKLQFVIPLKDEDEKLFFNQQKRVLDALVYNTFLLALAEGVWGGILFAIIGIPSPFFWGTMMLFLSIVPFVGTNTLLVPTAIILLLIGNYWEAVLLIVLGVIPILINQNVIRNRLDSSKSGMHPALVFLSCIGGLAWLGIIGFLAGPVLAALFIAVWDLFGTKYKTQLENHNAGVD